MKRKITDFLQDDNFIINVFEGKSLNDLIQSFMINNSELLQFNEAIKILNAPINIYCDLSDREKSEIKQHCISNIKEKIENRKHQKIFNDITGF